MADSPFITIAELLADPDPLLIPVRVKDKKSGEIVEKEIRVFPRRPTDVEMDMCRQAANRARREQRQLLLDEKSEEHALLLREPLEDADPEALRSLWVQGQLIQRAAEIQRESLEEREYVPEPEGDIITPAEQDAYDESLIGAEDDRRTNLIKAIETAKRVLDEEAKTIPEGALLKSVMPKHAETIAQGKWNDVYTANVIARCTFSDANYRKPYFKTVSEVDMLRSRHPGAYQRLADTHRALLLDFEPVLGF